MAVRTGDELEEEEEELQPKPTSSKSLSNKQDKVDDPKPDNKEEEKEEVEYVVDKSGNVTERAKRKPRGRPRKNKEKVDEEDVSSKDRAAAVKLVAPPEGLGFNYATQMGKDRPGRKPNPANSFDMTKGKPGVDYELVWQ